MRRDFTQCHHCGNHTVRGHTDICESCGYGQTFPGGDAAIDRGPRELIMLAIGFALAVAFIIVLLSGHVRA